MILTSVILGHHYTPTLNTEKAFLSVWKAKETNPGRLSDLPDAIH